jgi:type VII secretion effector (TIGR04197 family)
MSDDVINYSREAADRSAGDMRAGIAGINGSLLTAVASETNTGIASGVSNVSARSVAAMHALSEAISTNIENIGTLANQFEEFDGMIAAEHLLTEILNN